MYIIPMLRVALLFAVLVIAVAPTSVLAIDYATLYANISPSVVTVNTKKLTVSQAGTSVTPGIGTGFLIEPALVVTAAHVVGDADHVQVRFEDGIRIDAQVVASVNISDVALLKLKKPHPHPVLVQLGDSDISMVGSPVFIIGAPYGIEQALSVGYLSGRMSRGEMPDGSPVEFLQTDAAINPGNSGGPVFNESGQVIGIVSFILTKSGGFDGIGFASAINSAYRALMNSPGYLAGFEGLKLTELQARALNIPDSGILVQRVIDESVAHELGLNAGTIRAKIGDQEMLLGGDVILSVDCLRCVESEKLSGVRSVANKLLDEQSVTVKIFRDGETMTLTSRPIYAHIALGYR